MRKLFSYLYLIYCTLIFTITYLLVMIPMLIFQISVPEPRRIRLNHKIFKPWMDVFMFLIFCQIERNGKELVKSEKSSIIIANHTNFMDITLTSAYIPIPNKTLAKQELDKYPIFNILYRAGSILVDRKSAESRQKAFENMRFFLANEVGVCLFPEGTRNKSDLPVLRFKDGAFRLSMEENVPVVITILRGTEKVLNLDGKARPTKLRIDFLEKIFPADFKSVAEMRDYAHAKMQVALS